MKKLFTLIVISAILCSCTTEVPSKTDENITSTAETITSEIIDINEIEAIRNASFERQKKLSHKITFSPITNGYSVKYGNHLQNLKNTFLSGAVCYDSENDILYFTYYGGTNTLSKLENGHITEIIPFSAHGLNLWGGYLYYIADTDNPVTKTYYGQHFNVFGDIYRYNLETDENELFIDTNAHSLYVSEKGIQYTAGDIYTCVDGSKLKDERVFTTDFERTEIIEADIYPTADCDGIYYGDYKLMPAEGAIAFVNDNGDVCEVLPYNKNYYNIKLCGDNFGAAFAENGTYKLYTLNLKTGESFTYGGFVCIQDYVWIDDILYLTDGACIYECISGNKKSYYVQHVVEYIPRDISNLYTDGKNMYTVTYEGTINKLVSDEYSTTFKMKEIYE